MTRARIPRSHEVASARRDPRLLRAAVERQDDTAWRTRGACQSVDPETFFPAPTEAADVAVELCGRCVVQGACLAWALEVGDCHGVWGGTTARERRAMVVAWRTLEQPEETPYAESDVLEPVAVSPVPAQGLVTTVTATAEQPQRMVGAVRVASRSRTARHRLTV